MILSMGGFGGVIPSILGHTERFLAEARGNLLAWCYKVYEYSVA